ncbi:hypothetical protein TERTU_4400 [Teredinibacter turnerae T7901]|uniref:Uncharacterized protein n=1 Tax=Teredinibacter turnerae (strain ATCC 39867 / T7901) TaxID=377629 RepID=C5BJ00_TERTT|nr:hypothetical protein TERTU_4400 [Teredinibacter turnerae T7901]
MRAFLRLKYKQAFLNNFTLIELGDPRAPGIKKLIQVYELKLNNISAKNEF